MSYAVRVTRSGGGAVTVNRTQGPVKVVSANNIGTLVATAQQAAADAANSAAAAAASALAASGSASAAASSASAAEAAQTAAEAAQGAAEAAQAAAEVAQAASEAAQAAAEAAQAAAESEASDAAASALAAAASESAAAASEAAAQAAQAAAEAAQAAAEAAQSAAEAAQAAAEAARDAASGSASAADASAMAAAASESAAAVSEAAASGYAGAASSSAGTATTQAGIATAQAVLAAGSASAASGFADDAEAAQLAAEAAQAAAEAAAGSITLPLPIASGGTGADDAAEARDNLGLGTMAVEAASDYTPTSGLAAVALSGAYGDLTGTPALGGAAALNVGTTAGTVAAGDDSRITGAIQGSLLTTRGDIIVRGASAPQRLALGASGLLLRSDGTDAVYGTAVAASFATGPGIITPAMLDNGSSLSVLGRSTNSAGARADIAAANDGEVLRRSGTAVGFGTVATAGIANDAVTYAKLQNVSATARVLGRKTVSAGDAEECTLSEVLDFIGSAARGDILYRGASAWARLPAGTAGYLLQTGGAAGDPSWAAYPTIVSLEGLSLAAGDILYATAADTLARLAKGTDGQVLRLVSGLPAWTSGAPTIQVITASGTYTPSAGAVKALVEVVGGGGGGGGADATSGSNSGVGAGGGGGGYARELITLSGTYSCTVGAGGAAGSSSGGNGGTGGTTSFGTGPLLQATGGAGGFGVQSANTTPITQGGSGGIGSGADVNAGGTRGQPGFYTPVGVMIGGNGGASVLGGGGAGSVNGSPGSSGAGTAGSAYGGGGGGASCLTTTTGAAGGAGADGVIIVTEFY